MFLKVYLTKLMVFLGLIDFVDKLAIKAGITIIKWSRLILGIVWRQVSQ